MLAAEVLRLGDRLKVPGVYAVRDSAKVIQLQFGRDEATDALVGPAVS
jgi:hypothetical protein